jgi:CheY-like chemotaxis protein
VDDDVVIQQTLVDILGEDCGHNVKTASDGCEALGILASSPPPALVLVDLMMPRMDGAAFIERKSAQLDLARIPICVMTASGRWDAEPRRLAAIATQDFSVLRKPFALEDLLTVVERYC